MNDYVNPVGAGIPRLETREKLTGQAQFTDDLFPRFMLHGAVLSSPYPHARILSYDVSKARALPGVEAVVTGADLGEHHMGAFIKDETALARGKVRYIGEPVAAVAAVDLETARKAVKLIEVEYEELPAALTPEEALAPGAPIIHENLKKYFKAHDLPMVGNQFTELIVGEGDVDAAWAKCDVIVEGEYETQAQYHAYMEPCSALAEVDAAGKVTVWSGNQSVFRVQANVAELLGLPMAKVRAVTPRVGGAFGGKMEFDDPASDGAARPQGPQAGQGDADARAGFRDDPLAPSGQGLDEDRRDKGRHPGRARGAHRARRRRLRRRQPGRCRHLLAVRPRALSRAECPDRDQGGLHEQAARRCLPRLRRTLRSPGPARRRSTRSPTSSASIRSICASRTPYAAAKTGCAGPSSTPSPWSSAWKKCASASDWAKRRKVKVGTNGRIRSNRRAALPHISGLLTSGAIVRLLEDGTAVLNTGAVDNGQGSDTVLVQMCAELLGLTVDQISLATPDTDASPYNWGTTASRVTYMAGRAVVAAANSVVAQLKKHAGEMMECAEDDLELRPGGRIGLKGVPGKELPFVAISARCHWVNRRADHRRPVACL